ncbi:muconate cycloisomerase [Modestobacter sp. DSM 44400]|uniref:mandelate racemase/muconate lactonizing enzyme family protein n=1 Tax=Modestobacter sp. DSM 44400 TaxID=1550230 RepID=UPI0008988B46|nr:dipeptide epimerase [Modestobacter sp. DSM 44400]SDY89072.1 muconate cycloisomerase [Modestobacter sp. DSM 44400]
MSPQGSLRIVDIQTKVASRKLAETFEIFIDPITALGHVFVQVRTEGGVTGLGEVSSLGPFMGDSPQLIVDAIGELAPKLIGKNVLDLNSIVGAMNSTLRYNHAAKAALDFACHDAAGRALNIPTYQLLGGRVRDRIDCSWVIGIKPVEATLEEGVVHVEEGYRTLKVKIGRNDEEDIEKVLRLRREVGPEIRIRLDANQAYTAPQAIRVLQAVTEARIDSVEQPCRAEDLSGARRVREMVSIPVLADESIFSAADVVTVAEAQAVDAVNLKLVKAGGILGGREVATVCRAYGLPFFVGSNLELAPGISASIHSAASTMGVAFASDIYVGHQQYRADGLIAPESIVVRDGAIDVTENVGLGIDSDEIWEQL